MDKQLVRFEDLGSVNYKTAWDYQELLLRENVLMKSTAAKHAGADGSGMYVETIHHLLLCEHPPVYTLGKSGHLENLLMTETAMAQRGIEFYKTNRGGDITFHGPQQLVGYPIIDLEKFYTDIGRYLRELEQVIIFTLADFGIEGRRSAGETGVWIEPDVPGRERKICAMGVRCSRWVTMHGFALNVNTDLDYFKNIVPCGIINKQVTSMQKELNQVVDLEEVKESICQNFEAVFNVELI